MRISHWSSDVCSSVHPLVFIAPDYALGAWSVKPVIDPRPLFSPDILEHEFVEWVQRSHLLKRAFREVALIGGLIDRQHPGKRKTGRQDTFSPDQIGRASCRDRGCKYV